MLRSFLDRLLTVETLVAGAFYMIAAAILFADIVSRELFSQSIWGGQRMAVLLANGAALIGIGIAVALNRHIRPTVMDWVVPNAVWPKVSRLGHLVSAAVLFSGAYFGAVLVLDNKHMGFSTPPLDLKIWIPMMALPYGLASAGLRHLVFAIQPDLEPEEQEVM